ncbi:Rare lipoprotein A (RlpA)-like double-psi beta-barrel [Ancistrocladus abbreviatus]
MSMTRRTEFTMRGKGNFNMVMFSNVEGSRDVKGAWVKARIVTWVPMHRNWGANWQSRFDLRNQILYFKLTLVDGKTLEFYNILTSLDFGLPLFGHQIVDITLASFMPSPIAKTDVLMWSPVMSFMWRLRSPCPGFCLENGAH